MGFLSILSYAHKLIQERVSPGETVVDATAGNGVDTLFLAKCVGPAGSVHAFDVQEQALLRTRQRLEQELTEHAPVQLHHCSHALLQEKLPVAAQESLAAVMFNLGYLPGDDHQTVTQADSTVAALQQAVEWLRKGGIVTIILYTGHEGGEQEAEAVRVWAQQLSQKQYQVLEYRFMNQKNHPPYCIAVEKR
ncbi:class I SAM-dependent methyltransferase [Paenibacillus rigui]|uniref:SAM-dependent methyltransferase n=1 Tax=Paenibacillus rigui TaxID=554312 RepID=A0A229UYX5_9BACL|nr:class I SAM-dependent methyltransferase [Paenibacillus rigui]OXM88335.1 SAM-dependent methyltransferase [Paenibacillus rigui]